MQSGFLRTEFICIIWTELGWKDEEECSWGLNLFVLFEQICNFILVKIRSWGLNLFVLFERQTVRKIILTVLEDWIYLYYLNQWMCLYRPRIVLEDWIYLYYLNNVFNVFDSHPVLEDWIYLYYLNIKGIKFACSLVLEDWIYLYYLNHWWDVGSVWSFLRIEFICIIWT